MPHIDRKQVALPLALAIDIGSSSVRAILYDSNGHPIPRSEHRERYKLEIAADGSSMCDPLRIRRITAKCVRKVCSRLPNLVGDIEVVGMSCHWHSLIGLDRAGNPITPVYMWSDKRSAADAKELQRVLDGDAVHQRTGCRLHSSYWPSKLAWLTRSRAKVVHGLSSWCGLAEWLVATPGSPIRTSLSMASATGLLNTNALAWDEALLDHLDMSLTSLPEITQRQDPIPAEHIHPDLRVAGLKATWYPAIGDGAAANIGAGAVSAGRIALTIGTSGAIRVLKDRDPDAALPSGLFRYLLDSDTEVIGGALSNGGNMIAWLTKLTQHTDRPSLMKAAAKLQPDSHGLTILPFLAGERAPGWQEPPGGTITGITLDTTHVDILRAMLEATAHRFAHVHEDLQPFVNPNHTIIASGGALLQSPLWSQITADALGHKITSLDPRTEASARGTAISALQAHDVLSTIRTNPPLTRTFRPDENATAVYADARKRLEALEYAHTTWEQSIP